MATKAKLEFLRTDTTAPQTPKEGSLYAAQRGADKVYIPNGATQEVDCGVTVNIPEGVTVEITPDPSWERTGVRAIPQVLVGPLHSRPLVLTMFNHAGGTIRLKNGEEVAQIRAYESPQPILWSEIKPVSLTPEPPKETLTLKKPLVDPADEQPKTAA